MVIERIREPHGPAFDFLVHIFENSFPASERKSVTALRKMIESSDYCFYGAWIGDLVAGFSICAVLNGVDAALLEYMAVSAEQRGRGIGRSLFLHTASTREMAGRNLLIEVESVRQERVCMPDSLRRKAFYRQLGCREIEGLAYQMPPVSSCEPPPMNLLHYGFSSLPSVPKDTLKTWLEACYQQVYGVSMPDRRIDEMLAPLPSTIRLV